MTAPLMNADRAIDAVINNPASIAHEKYLELWNPQVQAQIDADIEAHRKADARVQLAGIPAGTRVEVEQTDHEFKFGAHIFNFDQLGSDELNERYKALYGTLFNSATIAFYWRPLEPERGHIRFAPAYEDTAAFWNSIKEPYNQPHWRRPATDPVVDFCEQKGIRLHGHTLTWGSGRWQHPHWVKDLLPKHYAEQVKLETNNTHTQIPTFADLSAEQIEAMLPEFTAQYNTLMAQRILQIALRYKRRLHSWDVVNESASDFGHGRTPPEAGLCKSWYGIMPGDYPYRSFKVAEGFFPAGVQLCINDYDVTDAYANQVAHLLERGCRIHTVGVQMHLFDPQACQDIADGKSLTQSPQQVREIMERMSRSGLPLHLSEITLTSPTPDERGQLIQALIMRNLYRLWFSQKNMREITWWNVVDGCGAPGEPAVSGLFTRDMQPKASYYLMNHLIHDEWKTRTSVQAGADGTVAFRGFRGNYRLSWKDANGQPQSATCKVS